MQQRVKGRLSKWRGGYGFIRSEGRDVFVHLSNFLSGFTPELNATVEFELGPGCREDQPQQAYRVRILSKPTWAPLDPLGFEQGGAA